MMRRNQREERRGLTSQASTCAFQRSDATNPSSVSRLRRRHRVKMASQHASFPSDVLGSKSSTDLRTQPASTRPFGTTPSAASSLRSSNDSKDLPSDVAIHGVFRSIGEEKESVATSRRGERERAARKVDRPIRQELASNRGRLISKVPRR